MIKLPLFARHQHEDGVHYHVTADGYSGGEYDLVFDLKKDAKIYKQMLKKSQRKLQGRIIRREYLDNFILDEREVW